MVLLLFSFYNQPCYPVFCDPGELQCINTKNNNNNNKKHSCDIARKLCKHVVASEAFSLVMKTNNCLRLRVLTSNACLHLAYVSSPGVRVLTWRNVSSPGVHMSSTGVCVLNWHMCPYLANMSSSRIDAHVFQ